MTINYKTNGFYTSKDLTEWYFGKAFVKAATKEALKQHSKTGNNQSKTWQDGTGYLTVCIEK